MAFSLSRPFPVRNREVFPATDATRRASRVSQGFVFGTAQDATEGCIYMTVVHQPVNEKAYNILGNYYDCGPNNPIQSVHSGGAQVLMADSSVHFLAETIPRDTLRGLADRDDDKVISEIKWVKVLR